MGESIGVGNSGEFIDPAEFCRRMGIGKTTMYKLIKYGHLRAGVHFFRCNGILRFIWDVDRFLDLGDDQPQRPPPATEPSNPRPHRKKFRYGKPFDS